MNTTLHKLNNEISPAFCRFPPECEYVTEKMWNISQIKPIEMVMISTDGQAYVKLPIRQKLRFGLRIPAHESG